jgi:hypothetical protein
MRDLKPEELGHVYGAGSCGYSQSGGGRGGSSRRNTSRHHNTSRRNTSRHNNTSRGHKGTSRGCA